MTGDSAERWRPDARFLLRVGPIVFGVGVVVSLLTQMESGDLRPFDLLLSGLASLLVFLVICGLLTLILHRLETLSGAPKAAALAAIFLFAGALSWLIVQTLLVALGGAGMPDLRQIATSLALSGLLAVLFGTAFYLYEVTRQRMLDSASRLKEAEFAEKELELARSIQERLLPADEIEGDGYRVALRNIPAHYVAGDFYDVFSLPDGALGLVVADVAGKGVGSSLIMASVKAVLPLLAAGRSVEATLEALNVKLCEELERRQFVALCFARFDPAGGEVVLANAGLPDPYLLRPGEAPATLAVPGPRLPLGLREEQSYRTLKVALKPADRLLILTDGLPEAPTAAAEPLGYERLTALFPPPGATPAAWLDDLLKAVRRVAKPEIEDDWTALLLERSAPKSGEAG